MQTITLIASRDVEKLRQKARKLKRAEALAHHEALDRVARDTGFDHWHHVCTSAKNFEPSERAFFSGCVVALDVKDAQDFDISDGVFIADEYLQFLCKGDLFEGLINSHEMDDPELPLLREVRTADDLKEGIEDLLSQLTFFRLRDETNAEKIEDLLRLVQAHSFWPPEYVWLRGECFDTYDIPSINADGDIVGLRM